MRPLIAITSDVENGRYTLKPDYVRAVRDAGGMPVILPSLADFEAADLARFDGVVLSGGDDAHVDYWGFERHPQCEPMDPLRHAGEVRVLTALDAHPRLPVFGICLGMQLMALHAGGRLHQHLADVVPETAEGHRKDRLHDVDGELGCGQVASWHHQGVADAGRLRVIARAPDGVVEALRDDARPYYLGVQWHPERTADPALGEGLFNRFVEACARK